jgi:hypothetical protein
MQVYMYIQMNMHLSFIRILCRHASPSYSPLLGLVRKPS